MCRGVGNRCWDNNGWIQPTGNGRRVECSHAQFIVELKLTPAQVEAVKSTEPKSTEPKSTEPKSTEPCKEGGKACQMQRERRLKDVLAGVYVHHPPRSSPADLLCSILG